MRAMKRLLQCAVLVTIGLGASHVSAAIPDADGIYYACYNTGDGSVRFVQSMASLCPRNFLGPVKWNQSGAQGPKGDTGAAGSCNLPTCQPGEVLVAGASSSWTCRQTCGGLITDTTADSANCGSCGVVCSEGFQCTSGTCQAPCAGLTDPYAYCACLINNYRASVNLQPLTISSSLQDCAVTNTAIAMSYDPPQYAFPKGRCGTMDTQFTNYKMAISSEVNDWRPIIEAAVATWWADTTSTLHYHDVMANPLWTQVACGFGTGFHSGAGWAYVMAYY